MEKRERSRRARRVREINLPFWDSTLPLSLSPALDLYNFLSAHSFPMLPPSPVAPNFLIDALVGLFRKGQTLSDFDCLSTSRP